MLKSPSLGVFLDKKVFVSKLRRPLSIFLKKICFLVAIATIFAATKFLLNFLL